METDPAPLCQWKQWEDSGPLPPTVVWANACDDRWQVEVVRLEGDGYLAQLRIFDRPNGEGTGNLMHTENVGLAYAARFGPDIDDVKRWEQITTDWVDAQ